MQICVCNKPEGQCCAILLKLVNLMSLVREFHLSLLKPAGLISILYFKHRMQEIILNILYLQQGL